MTRHVYSSLGGNFSFLWFCEVSLFCAFIYPCMCTTILAFHTYVRVIHSYRYICHWDKCVCVFTICFNDSGGLQSSLREGNLPCFWCLARSWYSVTWDWREMIILINYFLMTWNSKKLELRKSVAGSVNIMVTSWDKGDYLALVSLATLNVSYGECREECFLIWRCWMAGKGEG